MKALTLVSRKGGVGKSTSALHLAAAINARGFRVVLVDDDPNRPLVRWRSKGANEQLVVTPSAQLARHLTPPPDVLVWDSEAHPGAEAMKDLVTGADLIVAPMIADDVNITPLLAIREDIAKIHGAASMAVLLTMVTPNSREGERYKEALEGDGIEVVGIVRRYAAYGKAYLRGVTVREVEGGESAWSDYMAAADGILERLGMGVKA